MDPNRPPAGPLRPHVKGGKPVIDNLVREILARPPPPSAPAVPPPRGRAGGAANERHRPDYTTAAFDRPRRQGTERIEGYYAGSGSKRPPDSCDDPAARPAKKRKPDNKTFKDSDAINQWGEPWKLGEITDTDDHKFEGANVTVRGRLQVFKDPYIVRGVPCIKSRMAYMFQFFLVRPGAAGQGEVDEQIGYVHSWRVDKFTDTIPDKPDFIREFMQTPYDQFPRNVGIKRENTAKMMQALYNINGTLKNDLKNKGGMGGKSVEEMFLKDNLIFIEAVRIALRYQKHRFLAPMLRLFHYLVGHRHLPQWLRFHGTFILESAPLEDGKVAAWGELEPRAIQEKLVQAYNSRGGYRDYGWQDPGNHYQIRVMARTVAAHNDENNRPTPPPPPPPPSKDGNSNGGDGVSRNSEGGQSIENDQNGGNGNHPQGGEGVETSRGEQNNGETNTDAQDADIEEDHNAEDDSTGPGETSDVDTSPASSEGDRTYNDDPNDRTWHPDEYDDPVIVPGHRRRQR